MEEKNKTLGLFIAELRKEKGYTQGELADILHLSNKTISSWETDKTQPDIQMIPILAKIFDITCDELLTGEKNSVNIDPKTNLENYEKNQTIVKTKSTLVYKIVLAILIVIFLVVIFFFSVIAKHHVTGFLPLEYKIVNGVAYTKNSEGTYDVCGVADNYRGDSLIIVDEINGTKVTNIRGGAFSYTRLVQSIILSKNILSIESNAFMHCSVTEVVLNENLVRIDRHAFMHSEIEKLHLPSTLQFIGSQAFSSCNNLTEITGGDGLKIVEIKAFENCTSLKSVTINGKVSFEQCVFENCIELEKVELKNAESLELYLFRNSGLIDVYLSEDTRYVNKNVFDRCFRLKNIYVEDTLYKLEDLPK